MVLHGISLTLEIPQFFLFFVRLMFAFQWEEVGESSGKLLYTRAIIALVVLYCIRRAKPCGLHEAPRTEALKSWILSLCAKHFVVCERTMDSLIELYSNGGW